MTALHIVPSNALVAAFPGWRGRSIRQQEARERLNAREAARRAEAAVGFRALCEMDRRGDARHWTGRVRTHAFSVVTVHDHDALLAGPVVLLAKRWASNGSAEIAGIEAFEPENRARLDAWLARAAVVRGIELHVCQTGASRVERAAIVTDLSPQAPRPSRFVVNGKFDRRAIMLSALASARAARASTGAAWAVCLSAALVDAWQVAKGV